MAREHSFEKVNRGYRESHTNGMKKGLWKKSLHEEGVVYGPTEKLR